MHSELIHTHHIINQTPRAQIPRAQPPRAQPPTDGPGPPTFHVEVLAVVVGPQVHVLHDVALGPLRVLALPVLGGLQHGHARVGEVAGEGDLQGALLRAAQRAAGAAPAAYAALLEDAGGRGSRGGGTGTSYPVIVITFSQSFLLMMFKVIYCFWIIIV